MRRRSSSIVSPALRVAAFTALLTATLALPARAQTTDFATKSAARKLAADGQKLFDEGDYRGALEKFNLADSLVPAPTIGVRAARALVKLGRLVEASERYLDVTRLQLDRAAPAVMRKAQAEALAERDKLLPVIPSLEISLDGPRGAGVSVIVDQTPLPAALIGQKRPIDPGRHSVIVRRADAAVTRDVTLTAGEAARITITLPPLPAPPPEEISQFPYRGLGWTAIGIGAAGVVTAAVSGALAVSNEQSLIAQCGADRSCPPAAWGQSDTYDRLRTFTTLGIVVGAVGLAAGVPLLVLAPKAKEPGKPAAAARIEPWIGWGGAGLRGAF